MKIKDFCSINPPSNNFFDYINYIDTSSVIDGRLLNLQHLSQRFPSRARREIHNGDLLISSVRPNLKHNYFVSKEINHGIASTGFIQIRLCNQNWMPRYIYYYLTTDQKVNLYANIASSQTAFPAFDKHVIEEIDVPNISLDEQRHIVDTRRERSL